MPTYAYQCKKCAHTFDVFHSISASPRMKCEKCKGPCKKLLGTGAGLIFKGSGFYETDYKRDKGKAGKSEGGAESKDSGKSDAKDSGKKKDDSGKKSKSESTSKGSASE